MVRGPGYNLISYQLSTFRVLLMFLQTACRGCDPTPATGSWIRIFSGACSHFGTRRWTCSPQACTSDFADLKSRYFLILPIRVSWRKVHLHKMLLQDPWKGHYQMLSQGCVHTPIKKESTNRTRSYDPLEKQLVKQPAFNICKLQFKTLISKFESKLTKTLNYFRVSLPNCIIN